MCWYPEDRRHAVLQQCAGRAQRRRRIGSPPDGCGNADFLPATSAESKAAWRFASRRTARRWRVGHRGSNIRQVARRRFCSRSGRICDSSTRKTTSTNTKRFMVPRYSQEIVGGGTSPRKIQCRTGGAIRTKEGENLRSPPDWNKQVPLPGAVDRRDSLQLRCCEGIHLLECVLTGISVPRVASIVGTLNNQSDSVLPQPHQFESCNSFLSNE